MTTKKITIICLVILLIATAVTFLIFMTEPTAGSEAATKKTAMLVDVMPVEKGDFNPAIVATGTVQPVEDVMLSALVGGQVIRRAPAFSPGDFVEKGAVLLQIDPSDYQNTLELRKSELSQAQTNLEMEMGRQEVAEQDLELIGGDSLSAQQRALVLRKPQLNAAKAQVEAARAAVDQGQLNLARTTIRAPFDAHILSQNVTVGSQVSPGDNLGRLIGTENYRIILALPMDKLPYLNFPKSNKEKGAPVKIRNNTAWPPGAYRMGYLDEQIGALDEQTRLARVLVNVNDPFGLKIEEKVSELMIGAFVEAQVEAAKIKNVVRVPREYVRRNQTVWVMENGELSIRNVEIVLTDSKYSYISEGLDDGDQVVTTSLSTVAEGLKLRTETTNQTKEEKVPAPEE